MCLDVQPIASISFFKLLNGSYVWRAAAEHFYTDQIVFSVFLEENNVKMQHRFTAANAFPSLNMKRSNSESI